MSKSTLAHCTLDFTRNIETVAASMLRVPTHDPESTKGQSTFLMPTPPEMTDMIVAWWKNEQWARWNAQNTKEWMDFIEPWGPDWSNSTDS